LITLETDITPTFASLATSMIVGGRSFFPGSGLGIFENLIDFLIPIYNREKTCTPSSFELLPVFPQKGQSPLLKRECAIRQIGRLVNENWNTIAQPVMETNH
jgi:hypothetical protein